MMTTSKWHAPIALFLFLLVAPSLQAQDFLKQLEAKLFQKQQESKVKEKPPVADAPLKESGAEPEDLQIPGLLKPESEIETLVLPAPKAERKKPLVDSKIKPVPSPFTRALPNTPTATQLTPDGGGFLGLTVEANPGGGFGLTVVEVSADSPAWKAGFRNGDKVIAVSGQAVSTFEAFADQLARFAPGDPVKFLVERRGKNANLIAVLQDRAIAGQIHGTRPGTAIESDSNLLSNAGRRSGQAYFGVNVSDMSDAYRRQFGIPAYRGASVTEVVPNSPAHSAGLRPGDCIVEIEGAAVQSAEIVLDTILQSKPGQVISFSYYRGRQLTKASVPLASDLGSTGRTPSSISQEMLTPEYVASLQGDLERVHTELSETQARLQQLETRLLRMENKR